MPSTTLTCNKDTRIAESGDLGAGASDYLPVGLYSGYKYRSLLGFSGFSASWVSITNADLHIRTSSQFYVAFGSDPDILVQRITESWSEGSAVSLSGSNSTTWSNQPSATSTNQASKDVTTSENTWVTIDITALMQDALAAGAFYGIRLRAVDETASSDVTEFYAREYGSYDAYIDVTYTTNVAPSAPTFSDPSASEIVVPDLGIAFTHNDSDGDDLDNYDIQVSTDSTFASVTHLNSVGNGLGMTGNSVSTTYEALRSAASGTALTRGVTYYVRARTYSQTGILTAGAWSSARAFTVNSLPTTALTQPAATGRTARVTYSPGSGWASPRLYVQWSYADAQAAHATQVKYQVFIKNDADGSTFYDSGEVTSVATTLTIPSDLTEGNKYRIKVQVYDGVEWSGYSTELTVRARWASGLYRFDMGSAPTTLALDTMSTTVSATSSVVIEFSSNTTTSTPATFYATVGLVPLQRYFFYRVYLYAWDSATPTSPSLDELVIDYSTTIYIPDAWTRSDTSGSVIVSDPGSYVYGSRSLRISADGAKRAYQSVPILPDTDYILQGRMKSSGNSQGRFYLADTVGGSALVASSTMAATQDFARETLTVWNSGSRTAVYVICEAAGSAGTFAWFDALKLEASTVATPWSPGFVAGAIAIDAGGLQVDASAAGIFRLRGSTGGSRDLVELGASGLKFGGDTDLDAQTTAGELRVEQGTGYLSVKKPVVNVYTANDTWTKPTGIQYIVVEVIGGGGGSGGAAATGASQGACTGGGGGGGYARKLFTAADLSGDSTFDVTVGAGGTAGAAGNNAGGTGGTSSFAGTGITTVQATGGNGGGGMAAQSGTTVSGGGNGGIGSNGDVNGSGGPGGTGLVAGGARLSGGVGGNSIYGGGHRTSFSGGTGQLYGGGGGGIANGASQSAQAGEAGAAGIVIVTEYYA